LTIDLLTDGSRKSVSVLANSVLWPRQHPGPADQPIWLVYL
jgi:hypothetical protein